MPQQDDTRHMPQLRERTQQDDALDKHKRATTRRNTATQQHKQGHAITMKHKAKLAIAIIVLVIFAVVFLMLIQQF